MFPLLVQFFVLHKSEQCFVLHKSEQFFVLRKSEQCFVLVRGAIATVPDQTCTVVS